MSNKVCPVSYCKQLKTYSILEPLIKFLHWECHILSHWECTLNSFSLLEVQEEKTTYVSESKWNNFILPLKSTEQQIYSELHWDYFGKVTSNFISNKWEKISHNSMHSAASRQWCQSDLVFSRGRVSGAFVNNLMALWRVPLFKSSVLCSKKKWNEERIRLRDF